ncbi:3993_t:CDS:2 [Funneliformis geosporum]|uniref:3993_t:CDS:1 n=1 Tax=Funneliformis geosporum TaxID=1117311 RepID=A0A9W4SQ43_9GLOM|nr:3993_t:CDS:2 [Funneliformis geosporum]
MSISITKSNKLCGSSRTDSYPTFAISEPLQSSIEYYMPCCLSEESELSKVACQIYAILVNSASLERLFSSMKNIQTPIRNRLQYDKVLKIAQIYDEQDSELEELDFEEFNSSNKTLIKKEIEEELDEFNSNSFATLNSIHPTNDIKAK